MSRTSGTSRTIGDGKEDAVRENVYTCDLCEDGEATEARLRIGSRSGPSGWAYVEVCVYIDVTSSTSLLLDVCEACLADARAVGRVAKLVAARRQGAGCGP